MSNGSGNLEVRRGAASRIHSNMALFLSPRLLCLTILLAGVVQGQARGPQPSAAANSVGQDDLARIVNEVKGGNWSFVDQIVTEAGPVRAVPILHDLFANSQDTEVRERIAGALIKLGDKDGGYFDFVLLQATEAVENSPYPFRLDLKASPIPKPQQDNRQDHDAMLFQELSPEFVAWAKSRGVPVEAAVEEALYTIPGRLLQLGMTGDKRAIPVLRRGLSSPNIMIVAMAAQGLAELKDKDSIPLIIDACERAPAAAMALQSFDDPRAQSVAQSFFIKLQDANRSRAAGQGTNSDADQPK